MTFESRPYQVDAVNAVLQRYLNAQRQLLLRLPTGAGKTVISALLIDQLLPLIEGRKILFLAHRREIIDQTAEKIGAQIGSHRVSIEQAERKATQMADVVVASVQTLVGRLDEFDHEDFGVVIVDECHHAYAKTWMDTIGHFGKREGTLLLGLTATPKRSDGRSIGELFGETAFEISLGELQDQGYLVPMDYFTIEASLGLGDVPTDQRGEFQTNLLGKIMNTPEMRALTLRACLEKAKGRKTIAFCASVYHAEDLASDFNARGISAGFISGQSQDRDELIAAFREGSIQVLTNYGVLTEGFDDPSIECVLLARPTTSPLVYSQCLGRGLRSYAGKESCIVIDIIDRQSHQLQYNVYESAGLPRMWQGSGKDPLREAESIAKIRVTDPNAFLRIRQALSLHEVREILMGLDPRTVLAGIDGVPMYQPPLASRPELRRAPTPLSPPKLEPRPELKLEKRQAEKKPKVPPPPKPAPEPYKQPEKRLDLRSRMELMKSQSQRDALSASLETASPPSKAVTQPLLQTRLSIQDQWSGLRGALPREKERSKDSEPTQ